MHHGLPSILNLTDTLRSNGSSSNKVTLHIPPFKKKEESENDVVKEADA